MRKVDSLAAFPRSAIDGRIRYPAILESIRQAIINGRLAPGDALPTHRALARHLETAIGTVSRAYAEAERLGLVVGEVGRGTYVSMHRHSAPDARVPQLGSFIDLTLARPPNDVATIPFANALRKLSKRRDIGDLLGNEPPSGWLRHRLAAAKWLSSRGVLASAENVVACNGVQHALSVVLAAIGNARDVVATEELNYPGIQLLAKLYDLNLVGIPMDHEGLRADALDRICHRQAVRFLLCSPTMHNPTTVTMSMARRRQIVEVARKRGLIILENDILGMMPVDRLPPLAGIAPERSCYLTGLSKVVATGLRLGFIVAPEAMLHRVTTALHGTTWMPPPLMLEIFTLLVEDGSIASIIDEHRIEAKARGDLVHQILTHSQGASVANYFAWMPLPARWSEDVFVDTTRLKRVLVTPGRSFAISGHGPISAAIRIGLGSVNSRQQVESGLRQIALVLGTTPPRSAHRSR